MAAVHLFLTHQSRAVSPVFSLVWLMPANSKSQEFGSIRRTVIFESPCRAGRCEVKVVISRPGAISFHSGALLLATFMASNAGKTMNVSLRISVFPGLICARRGV